ncbi:MAG: response regulator transcription factor [Chloroflexi bacterium]|nr:response regulator transcription factor [Chloroflexota bacterium]
MMRVLICDDQAIIRDGLELLLRLEKDIEVVAKAQDGAEAISLVERYQPDIVLMDLKMPLMNGVEATERIHRNHPGVKVLILTTYDDDEWLFDALRAGASGYLLKDTPREDVIKAVRGTVAGKTYMDPAIAGKLVQQAVRQPSELPSVYIDKLTGREVEVLSLLARGLSNNEIADQLKLSEGTVRNHVSAIFAKLEVSDRTQAAIIAIRYGLGE